MKNPYQTIRQQRKANEQELTAFLTRNGQGLLPMVELIEQSRLACDQLIDVTSRAVIQAVLHLFAAEVAGGPPQQSKRRSAGVVFYGRQAGQVLLRDRKLEVQRPRLRRKGRGGKEVEIPSYTAMQNQSPLGARILDTLRRGVSTRNYKDVIPRMAETVGVSKSVVSRATIEASEAELEAQLSRRFDELKLLIIYVGGLVFGEHMMIGAVGVYAEGYKHVLGIREGRGHRRQVFVAGVANNNQHHRKPARRSAHPNSTCYQLAKRRDGAALDGFGFSENGEEFPQDHGLQRTLDAGGDSERIAGRHATGSEIRGVVTSTQPPWETFNYVRDILSLFPIFCFVLFVTGASRRQSSAWKWCLRAESSSVPRPA